MFTLYVSLSPKINFRKIKLYYSYQFTYPTYQLNESSTMEESMPYSFCNYNFQHSVHHRYVGMK